MPTRSDLEVNAALTIPRHELEVRVSRAGGAGGQHVNTSSTRVELAWNIATSQALTDAERERLRQALRSRLTADSTLRVVASERRSQAQNREAAETRLAAIVRRALIVPRKRRATKPTRGSVERRLQEKRRRSDRKRQRRAEDDYVLDRPAIRTESLSVAPGGRMANRGTRNRAARCATLGLGVPGARCAGKGTAGSGTLDALRRTISGPPRSPRVRGYLASPCNGSVLKRRAPCPGGSSPVFSKGSRHRRR